jgi:release factor glutamine methyltransferase
MNENKQDKTSSVWEAWREASSFLGGYGVEDAGRHAELLLLYVLGWDRSTYLLRRMEPAASGLWDRLAPLLERKAAGEPSQYIIGEQEFYGLPFEVSPSVLIPRPETELLVERLLVDGDQLWPSASGREPLVIDIGTGSGAIPVTTASMRPDWRVCGTDLSEAALMVAKRNAEKNGVGARLNWLHGDLLEPVIQAGLSPDAVISNPPYIPSGDIPTLQIEVRGYEPMNALDGGDDGLDLYRRLIGQLPQLPVMPKWVGLEVGIAQAGEVAGMLERVYEWSRIDIVKDLAGIDRHVVALRDE